MTRLMTLLAGVMAFALTAGQASAQGAFPTKPVKVLVPYAAGGATDVVARLVAEQMRASLKQAVVVENKPGASGIIAIEEMARAKPDGYTVLIGNISTNALTPILLAKKMSINYEKEVRPIARLANIPSFLLATTSDFPPTTVAELIAYAKARPGKVRYASAGFGAYQQLDSEHFARRAGIELAHIPIKAGGSQIIRDVASGDVQMTWFNIANSVTMIRAGRVRPIAIALEARHPEWPDVPTMAEAGFPGVGSGQWQAAFVPAGTPDAVVETLNRAIMQALQSEALQAAYKKGGIVAPASNTPAEAKAWIDGEMDKWKKLIAELNIVMEE